MDAQVLASYGHVRDLAEKPGSVKPEADFEMVWSTAGFASRQRGLADIVAAMKVLQSLLHYLCMLRLLPSSKLRK